MYYHNIYGANSSWRSKGLDRRPFQEPPDRGLSSKMEHCSPKRCVVRQDASAGHHVCRQKLAYLRISLMSGGGDEGGDGWMRRRGAHRRKKINKSEIC